MRQILFKKAKASIAPALYVKGLALCKCWRGCGLPLNNRQAAEDIQYRLNPCQPLIFAPQKPSRMIGVW
jgi:hypothetical protein